MTNKETRNDRLKDAYLIRWNKRNRTTRTHTTEFIPRRVKSDRWVPDLFDRKK